MTNAVTAVVKSSGVGFANNILRYVHQSSDTTAFAITMQRSTAYNTGRGNNIMVNALPAQQRYIKAAAKYNTGPGNHVYAARPKLQGKDSSETPATTEKSLPHILG